MYIDLSGSWSCEIPGFRGTIRLPGTLDESSIGFPDSPASQWKVEEVRRIGFYREGDPIVTRLTRRHTFEGAASISRTVEWDLPEGRRVFVEVERARQLRLWVNGTEVPPCRPGCLSAPWCFEVTGRVTGRDELVFRSDNSYPGWPRDAIVYASAASDETQTNWNGLLGFIRFRVEAPVFLSGLRVYPRGPQVDLVAELDAAVPWQGELRFTSPALESPASVPAEIGPGKHTRPGGPSGCAALGSGGRKPVLPDLLRAGAGIPDRILRPAGFRGALRSSGPERQAGFPAR